MDAGPGVNPPLLIAPSQRPGVSSTPLGTGTDHTRQTFHHAQSHANTLKRPWQARHHPTASCHACRIAFRAPSHRQTAQRLCPPCQARHAGTTPQDRTVRRANPYPVTTTRALALAVAFTCPRFPAPSPTLAPPQSAGGGIYASGDVLGVCMRFGCGARLPAHVLGDMCEACVGAGFGRPSPAVLPKRVPRRATERTAPRPRESLDVVRASLLAQATRHAEVTTEKGDVESELEADLVYPDDVLVEESKPIEDEDAELELVYPEDAAEDTRTPPSRPRTRTSPSTALRELFKDGPQTIPALQDLVTREDKGPAQRCRVPGCDEALPAQSCMQRCVKCSVGDWKRRRQAAATDASRRPSTSSPTTDTSMEEREVTTMLDDISDAEGGSDLPPSLSSHSKGGSNKPMGDSGIISIPGWDSDLTELSCSDSDPESISDSGPELDSGLTRSHGDTTGLRIRIPLLVTRLPPGSSFRKCGNKRCNIAVPKDHRWKTCDPCRRAQRVRFEKRRSNEGLKPLDLSCRRWRSLSPAMREIDMALTPETSRPCSVRHCRDRIPLPEVYQWKTCIRCRARARREARRKRDLLLETRAVSCQPEVMPRFPAYQNRGALLSSFDAQLKGFVEGQIMYFRAKLQGGIQGENEPSPMIFLFVGEYSMVTGQRMDSERNNHGRDRSTWPNDPAELEAMRQEVSSIVLEMECVLRAKFGAGEAFTIDRGGIIVRFTCSLELIAQLRPLATVPGPGPSSASESGASQSKDEGTSREGAPTTRPPPNPPAVPLVKTLCGELEAVFVPDESHRLFHGRRTVIRYRMVG